MKAYTQYTTQVLQILCEEILPAEGCTEPIAIAYTAAKAREILGFPPDSLHIHVSGNMIKNVKSVVVPNSGGMCGIECSAAMGALAGNALNELLVISDITPDQMVTVRQFLSEDRATVILADNDIKLYVKVVAKYQDQEASVEIKHLHTNITEITKNGETLLSVICNDTDFNSPLTDRQILSIELIYNLAKVIDVEQIKPLFQQVIKHNTHIAKVGLSEKYGVNIGAMIKENIKDGIYGDDIRNRAASLASAGSDARMSGCPLPVMTTSGSGNQGLAASLPIIQYAKDKNLSEEQLLRTLFFSHTTTIHLKTNIGRLSAYCGVICASAAVSGALSFVEEGSLEEVGKAIINTLGNISGVICDGAKASCAGKIATGVYSAFDSHMLAKRDLSYKSGDGIIGLCIEKTIQNIGRLSQEGMQQTDKTILGIMMEKNTPDS